MRNRIVPAVFVAVLFGIGITILAFAFDSDALETLAWPGAQIERVVNPAPSGTLKKDPNMTIVVLANALAWSVVSFAGFAASRRQRSASGRSAG